jgi:hypothetical protein
VWQRQARPIKLPPFTGTLTDQGLDLDHYVAERVGE